MIAANKRLLQATLTEGVLQIQTHLIQLYTDNLNAVATQAALIAGFSFSIVTAEFDPEDKSTGQITLTYLHFICFTVCLCAALFALSQATIVTMFGPSKALKGDCTFSVKLAADDMRKEQKRVFFIAITSITALFFGSTFYCWANQPFSLAALNTCVYIIGYSVTLKYGLHGFEKFHLADDITVQKKEKKQANGKAEKSVFRLRDVYQSVRGDNTSENQSTTEHTEAEQSRTQAATTLKHRGVIWKRKPFDEGGNFVQRFAVLNRGLLDFYKNEERYQHHENPENKVPIKLWEYTIETNAKKFERHLTSLKNTLKVTALGTQEFKMKDILNSEYDLKEAALKYKFALMPKVETELLSRECIEFVAADQSVYEQWINALSTVIDAFDSTGKPTVEGAVRTGAFDVESSIMAANT